MAKKNLPVYELDINEDEMNKSGFQYCALVDDPAVQMEWYGLFSNQKPEILQCFSSDERRLATAVMVRADFQIYRNDPTHGEHFVKFTKEVNEKILKKLSKLEYRNNVNLMHDPNQKVDKVYLTEIWMVDASRGILPPKGMEVEDGSIMATYFVEDDQIWEDMKSGKYNGLSMEGFFGYNFSEQAEPESDIDQIISILNSITD